MSDYHEFEKEYMTDFIRSQSPKLQGKAGAQITRAEVGQLDTPEITDMLDSLGFVGKSYLDMGAATVKGATQGYIGLPGDIEGLVRTVANKLGADVSEETLAPTTEEVKKFLDQYVGKVGDGNNSYETLGEFAAPGGYIPPAKAAARQLKKGIEKTGEFVQDNKEVLKPTGSINMGGGDGTKPAVERTTDDFGFYSKALDETQKLKQAKGTGQQFKQMLVKSGVKQEEIDWLGLEDVFKEKKVTKDDIVKHINDNRIKLREVVATGESKVNMEFGEGVELTPAQTYGDNYIDERAGELMEEVATSQNEVYGSTLDYDDAVKMAEEEYYNDPVMKYVDPKTDYTIIGNDNLGYSIYQSEAETVGEYAYQNAFATSGGRKRFDMRRDESGDLQEIYSLDEAEVQARGLAETNGDLGMEGDTRWSDYVEPDGENYQELRFQLDDDEVKFTEGVHFSDDKNNLFHIRTTDRDYNGDKVLYVEELQSDWGQKGRDKGFKPEKKEEKILKDKLTTSRNKLTNTFNEYTILENDGTKTPFVDFKIKELKESIKQRNPDVPDDAPIMKDVENDLVYTGSIFNKLLDAVAENKVFKNNEQVQEKRSNLKARVVDGLRSLESDALPDLISLEKLARDHRALQLKLSPYLVERSPFVTSTDKWTQLAIKRLLSKAIDEGYDYVSFSPGDVQYERWNNEGLITYYDYIVPKNAEKVLKQIDKDALTYLDRNELGLDNDRLEDGQLIKKLQEKNKIPDKYIDSLYETNSDILQNVDTDSNVYTETRQRANAFTIKLTPQVKDKVTKGQSMFEGATPAVAVGAAAVGMSEDNNGRE